MEINMNKQKYKIMGIVLMLVILFFGVDYGSQKLDRAKEANYSSITFPVGAACGNKIYTCDPGVVSDEQLHEIKETRTVRTTTNINDVSTVKQEWSCNIATWTCDASTGDSIGCIRKKPVKSWLSYSDCKCLTNCDYPLSIREDGKLDDITSKDFSLGFSIAF